jgi:hypothetical protein
MVVQLTFGCSDDLLNRLLFFRFGNLESCLEKCGDADIEQAVVSGTLLCDGINLSVKYSCLEVVPEELLGKRSVVLQPKADIQVRNNALIIFRERLDHPHRIPFGVALVVSKLTSLKQGIASEIVTGNIFIEVVALID